MSAALSVPGRILVAGTATGRTLTLDTALSFWGGLDPVSGTVIDRSHPQVGRSIGGRIVCMPGSRGSSGTPGVLGEALRRGVGPSALIVTQADINLIAGVLVAQSLYPVSCPIVLVDPADFKRLADAGTADAGAPVRVRPDGTIEVIAPD